MLLQNRLCEVLVMADINIRDGVQKQKEGYRGAERHQQKAPTMTQRRDTTLNKIDSVANSPIMRRAPS